VSGRDSDVIRWREAFADCAGLSSSAKCVGFALSISMNASGKNAAPGIELLARRASLTTRTVTTALGELVLAGWIVASSPGGGKRKVTVYEAGWPSKPGNSFHETVSMNGLPGNLQPVSMKPAASFHETVSPLLDKELDKDLGPAAYGLRVDDNGIGWAT
jgi:hypothetical protein